MDEHPARLRRRAGARATRRRWPLVLALGGAVALVAVLVPTVLVVVPWWLDGSAPPVQHRLAVGRDHSCAVRDDRTVTCWGANGSGQLGNGSTDASTTPVAVTGLTDVVSLAAAGEHSCALTGAGAAWCWGDNANGQLGTGDTVSSTVPVQVRGLGRGVLAVATGEGHSCALLGDRSVRCWGDNGAAQLGTGDTQASAVPVPVRDLPPRSTGVAVGNGFTCVAFTGRTLRCWGDNSDGQLGLGDLRPRTRWEPVIGLPRTGVVAAGDAHACSVTKDGVVYCWGSNRMGQLGIVPEAEYAEAPMAVPGLEGRFTSVSAGYDSSCARSDTGGVTCWGGAQGPGGEAAPVHALSLPRVLDVAVGSFHACATTEGGIFCWGSNRSGQLGSGSGVDSPEPVAVAVA